MPERGDADRARRLVTKRRKRSNFTIDVVKCRPQAGEELFACLGQRQAARCSRDQSHADPLFKHADAGDSILLSTSAGCGGDPFIGIVSLGA
jgi:hypothetical protein